MNTIRGLAKSWSVLLLSTVVGTGFAMEVKLTPSQSHVEVIHNGDVVKVHRIQDQNHQINGGFAKTSRRCPPFCIQPMQVAPGVRTVGELDVFSFMEKELLDGTGLIVDARTPAWHKRGTIPGSVNIPFTTFGPDSDESQLIDVMKKLGVRHRGEVNGLARNLEKIGLLSSDLRNDDWDFMGAKDLILWCNGPWCGQSPRAINLLLKLGYPAEKLYYYRGGMQMWQLFGLTTVTPG